MNQLNNEIAQCTTEKPNDIALAQPPSGDVRDSENNQAAQSLETGKDGGCCQQRLVRLERMLNDPSLGKNITDRDTTVELNLSSKMRHGGRWRWPCKAWTVTATGIVSIALLGSFYYFGNPTTDQGFYAAIVAGCFTLISFILPDLIEDLVEAHDRKKNRQNKNGPC